MTDELLNSNSDDLVSSSNPELNLSLVTTATPANFADGKTALSPCDGDYQSDTESEKPIILELGTSSNIPLALNSVYPLDMHLSSTTAYLNPHGAATTFIGSTESPNVSSSSLLSSHIGGMYLGGGGPYVHPSSVAIRNSYIPQTVCSWSAPELETNGSQDVVPPPMYMSYIGSRELSIVKEVNPSWKEKAMQIEKDYKKTACDRERTRMRDMNRAFDLLRSKLPISKPNGKKYSKIESLRIAINYIHHLQECLKSDPSEVVNFSSTSKLSSRGNTVDFIFEANNRRSSDAFSFRNDRSKDYDGGHGEIWTASSFLPNSQDQWD